MTEENRDISAFHGLARTGDDQRSASEILKESRELDEQQIAELVERYAKDETEEE